jgi:hypothetical protein
LPKSTITITQLVQFNDDDVSMSNFTSKKQNTRVLKGHTKTVTILFYVSGALQTCIGSWAPIVEIQDDTASNQTPEDDEDGTGEEGVGR